MTNSLKNFMIVEAVPFNGMPDVLCHEIVRYFHAVDKFSIRRKGL